MNISLIDIQGHRGCRGLLPENTSEGFIKAINLGVTTLEMDVVVSKDKKAVVSHEAYFNHEITTLPDGTYLSPDSEKEHKLYEMTHAQIMTYDVGLKPHPRFPQQQKLKAIKPLLTDVISQCDIIKREGIKNRIRYNIEIKREESGDGIFQPHLTEFVEIICNEVLLNGIEKRTTIQSFDPEILNQVNRIYPNLKTAILVENQDNLEVNLRKLNHRPAIYSPDYKLVSPELVKKCHHLKMRIIPWTVNNAEDVSYLIKLGVDGIISDYPDMVKSTLAEMKNDKS
ncbi:MAG: glycerophosphodiester phosphodiesterase [Saprospiraceae bacterium]|nr:glycerophosphodiester phosphodiesterase [Saprospiraceae bacterium]